VQPGVGDLREIVVLVVVADVVGQRVHGAVVRVRLLALRSQVQSAIGLCCFRLPKKVISTVYLRCSSLRFFALQTVHATRSRGLQRRTGVLCAFRRCYSAHDA